MADETPKPPLAEVLRAYWWVLFSPPRSSSAKLCRFFIAFAAILAVLELLLPGKGIDYLSWAHLNDVGEHVMDGADVVPGSAVRTRTGRGAGGARDVQDRIPGCAARSAGDGPPPRREERRVKGLLRKRGYFGVAFVTPIDLRIRGDFRSSQMRSFGRSCRSNSRIQVIRTPKNGSAPNGR